MNKKDFKKLFEEKQQQAQLNALDANSCRAQSVSIGASASGVTEITMRGVNGNFLWEIYQPVQVVELINQLAASIGCRIHIQPRNDFASWRVWREPTEEDRNHLNGFPPFAEWTNGSEKVGLLNKNCSSSELNHASMAKDGQNETVATEKPKHKRSAKRAATTA